MEQKILITAFQNLEKLTGIKGDWENIPPFYIEKGYDVKVKLKLKNKTITQYGIVKKEFREHQLFNILGLLNKNKEVILIAENIFPKIKEKLRNLEIGYLDANGNIFFCNKDIYIFIEVQNKKQKITEKVSVFTKVGLKLLFTILTRPELINVPYRQIADEADVALGTINNIMNSLKSLGYIIEIDKDNRKLNNIDKLIERWIVDYNQKLKPALHLGNFRFLNENDYKDWKKIKFNSKDTLWGGEPAADLITNYLKPGEFTLYTDERKNELMKNYKLVPDVNGDIVVYKKFWKHNMNDQHVPELLVYTDLINTGNERNHETAKMIYEKFGQKWQ